MLAVVAVLPTTRAFAIVGVSNLGESSDDYTVVENVHPISLAASFLTGPVAMTLDSVDLWAFHLDFYAGTTGFTVSLATDSDGFLGGIPGNVIAPLSGPDPTGATTYQAPANLVLAADTPYWIIASVDENVPDAIFGLLATLSTAETGLPGWSVIDGQAYSVDSGATWSRSPTTQGYVFTPQFGVNVSEVGQAVPEASTYAAGGTLALMITFAWRRHLMRQQS